MGDRVVLRRRERLGIETVSVHVSPNPDLIHRIRLTRPWQALSACVDRSTAADGSRLPAQLRWPESVALTRHVRGTWIGKSRSLLRGTERGQNWQLYWISAIAATGSTRIIA